MKKAVWAIIAAFLLLQLATAAQAQVVGPAVRVPLLGSGSGGSSTITSGSTVTSGCLGAGGVLRSISNRVECGAGLTKGTYTLSSALGGATATDSNFFTIASNTTSGTIGIGYSGTNFIGSYSDTTVSAWSPLTIGGSTISLLGSGNASLSVAATGAVTIAPGGAGVPLTINNGANAVSPLVVQDNSTTKFEILDGGQIVSLPAASPWELRGAHTVRINAGGSTGSAGYLELNYGSGDLDLVGFGGYHGLNYNYAARSTSTINSSFRFTTNPGNTSNGFGTGILIRGQSSTTASQDMIRVAGVWTDATHASRSAAIVFDVVNGAAALAEVGRFNAVGGLKIATGTKPTCDSTYRGTIYYVAGGAGVADTYEACVKDAGDSYAWTAIF